MALKSIILMMPITMVAVLLAGCSQSGGGPITASAAASSAAPAPAPAPSPAPTPTPAPTPSPTTSPAGFVPVVVAQRPIPSDLFGYNFNVLRSADVLSRGDFRTNLRGLRAATLRIPGGTVGEYWSWARGGLLPPPYIGLPAPPPFNAEQLALTGATIAAVDATLDAADATALFAINALTRDLDTNIADLRGFEAIGQPVRAIEIGNEEYFRTPNNVARFPTASAYAALARDWSVALKAAFPAARTAAIAPSPVRQTGISFGDWVTAIEAANGWSTLDAIAIHPYAEISFPVVARSDAEAMTGVTTLLAADNAYLDAVRARLPAAERIWITEWNTNDNATAPAFAGSWIHALSALARALNFLDFSQVDYVLQHVVQGDLQWQAMTAADGRLINFGNWQSGTAIVAPFTLTASGRVMALLGDAMRGGGRAMKLNLGVDEQSTPVLGYRFVQADGDVVTVIVNASDRVLRFALGGRARRLSALPWSSPVTAAQMNETVLQLGGDGLAMPAFSAAIVDERGTAGLF